MNLCMTACFQAALIFLIFTVKNNTLFYGLKHVCILAYGLIVNVNDYKLYNFAMCIDIS